jgi:hypothetical protein
MNGTHLVYAGDVNLLNEDIQTFGNDINKSELHPQGNHE